MRHCEEQSDEAIHDTTSGNMDCFAEPVIGPRFARTRWLVMTKSHLPFDQLQLELGDRLGGIETLRTGLGAVHDGVAAIEPERILEIVEALSGGLVAGVGDPARGLQQRGRTEEALAVPPIARAGGRAAGAENALIKPVELFTVLVALLPFLLRRRRGLLQPSLDRGV